MFGPRRRMSRRTARRTSRRVASRQQAMQGPPAPAQPEAAAPAPAPASSAPAEPDYTAELEKLAQLNKQGVLTDEEFAAKKKQLLGL